MTVRADASRLKSRLNSIAQATRMAPYALSSVAIQTIEDVSTNAQARLAGREDQVGFDLPQFTENIREPGPLEVRGARGTVGILDVNRMGTEADFEKIAHIAGLWHSHLRGGRFFKAAVFDNPDIREELAHDRQAVWGETTPQWFLMENGYSGDGAYPPVPASHFIASATRGDRMTLRLRNAMTSLYNGIPRR